MPISTYRNGPLELPNQRPKNFPRSPESSPVGAWRRPAAGAVHPSLGHAGCGTFQPFLISLPSKDEDDQDYTY